MKSKRNGSVRRTPAQPLRGRLPLGRVTARQHHAMPQRGQLAARLKPEPLVSADDDDAARSRFHRWHPSRARAG
jgi:hypothetical protein